MQIGWIDFSKSDRNKVIDVLNLLSEPGVLDELGIAQIRDGFSNLFFPGITTIQTRAKYFLMVPYIFKSLESYSYNDFSKLKKELEKLEKNCARSLLKENENDEKDDNGVIGKLSIPDNKWVKRPPSSIYWAGLKTYGIFTKDISIDQYLRNICLKNSLKENISKSSYSRDSSNRGHDDKGDGDIQSYNFWNIETYETDWFNGLKIDLTKDEGDFLKRRIIESNPCSMLAFILKNNCDEILKYESFSQLVNLEDIFPDYLNNPFHLAKDFSDFNRVLMILFNVIASDGKNEVANDLLDNFNNGKHPNFNEISNIDLNSIFNLLDIKDIRLKSFLLESQQLMKEEKIDELKERIKKREISLKGENRSKTCHPEQFEDKWFGVYELDYRFRIVKNILGDIFKSQHSIRNDNFDSKGRF